jgi:hypothetical protein
VSDIMQFFAFSHLPLHLQEVSAPFGHLAVTIMALPDNEERSVALRKLLEAKDAAVRAKLARPTSPGPGWEWDEFAKQWKQTGATGPALGRQF